MAGDVARAASRDDLRDALDYSAVAHTVKCVVIEGKFQLIETAAERVAQRLIADFGLEWVRIQVVKPITGGASPPPSPVGPAAPRANRPRRNSAEHAPVLDEIKSANRREP